MPGRGGRVYSFGPFQLDAAQRRLTRDHRDLPLAPKTLDLLQFLAENPGRLLTKNQLMSALWPETAVEEINLAFQISTLRKALGEEGAKCIETVPKHGYRFVADLRPVAPALHGAGGRSVFRYSVPAAAVLAAAALVSAGAFLLVVRGRTEQVFSMSQVTALPGVELYPTLSPDGSQVVFSWNASGDSYDLYLQTIGADVPARITNNAADDLSASWSPDGRSVAFLRYHSPREAGVYALSLPGGPERQLATVQVNKFGADLLQRYGTHIAWHPNGKWLVAGQFRTGLVTIPVGGGEQRPLLPSHQSGWDEAPSFSPDGKALVFVRVHGFSTSSVFRVGLTEELEPVGKPDRLTHMGWTASPVWSPGGETIYYLFGFQRTQLWRFREGKHERLRYLPAEIGRASTLSVPRVGASGGMRLAFSTRAEDSNIWTVVDEGSRKLARPSKMPPFLNSVYDEVNAHFSPDGRRIAFMSSRSGRMEIWVCDADGRNPVQLTDFGATHVGGPQWSPDGTQLVFPAVVRANPDVYSVPAGGGPVRRLTDHVAEDSVRSWSRDGKWIYFISDRGDKRDWRIWRMPRGGGRAVQITQNSGGFSLESLDRTRLFFGAPSRRTEGVTALWAVSIAGRRETTIVDPIADGRAFVVVEEGIYFVESPAPHGGSRIGFHDFATSRVRWIADTEAPARGGISVFPLERAPRRTIMYIHNDRSDSDVYLLETQGDPS